jgi:hypothetical protein
VNIISRRISDATGLVTFPENEASELFQVANYGMAGRYTPHTDYITGEDHIKSPIEQLRGNRIATFMVYVRKNGQFIHKSTSVTIWIISVGWYSWRMFLLEDLPFFL